MNYLQYKEDNKNINLLTNEVKSLLKLYRPDLDSGQIVWHLISGLITGYIVNDEYIVFTRISKDLGFSNVEHLKRALQPNFTWKP